MIALGTSSWTFDAWRGVFYPEGVGKAGYLAYYARQFPSVEVNTSFYGLPEPSTLIKWVESVPVGFSFALKFPKAISHEKRLLNANEETLAYLDVLRALGQAAAPGFLQLPPHFTRQREGKNLALYLDWLATVGSDLALAVEVRAADLMTPAFAKFVAEHGVALVLADRKGTADLFDIWQAARDSVGFSFIRWIGDDRNGPTGDRELAAPRNAQLDQWASRLASLHAAGQRVYGYMHNPYEGHSPASVQRLLTRLAALGIAPDWPPPGAVSGAEDAPDPNQELPGQMRLY